MRIGIVSYDFSPPIGGLGVVAKQYRDRLQALYPEHSFIVLSPAPGGDDSVSGLARFFWRKRGGCPIFSLVLALRLSALVKRHQIDLLHIHAGSGGVFLLRKPHVPTIVTSHHTYLQEAKFVFAKMLFTAWRKKGMAKFEARTYRLADRITCVSKDTADALIREYGIDRSKITVVENGLDPALFEASSFEKHYPDTVLYVGRLEERKGVRTLLEAWKILRKRGVTATLRLLGSNILNATRGPAAENSLEFDGEKYALGERQEIIGPQNDERRNEEIARATLLIVPSLLEGFGLVAAEGMALGTCVIASDSPGLSSLIADGRTGVLFRAGDAEDLAKKMEDLLMNAGKRRAFEEAAREEARVRFNCDARAGDLMKVFLNE